MEIKQEEIEVLRESFLKKDHSFLSEVFRIQGDFCIKNLIKKTKCSKEDAEDIFIESVMNFREKVLRREITYITKVRNYIYTTCLNMWSAKVQKEQVKKKRESDIEKFFYAEFEKDPMAVASEDWQIKNLLKITKEAFMKLSEKCQDILHYFYVDKYSLKEIAGLVGLLNADVAKSTKSKCFKRLRTYAVELNNENGENVI